MALVRAPGQTFTIGAGGLGDDTYIIGDTSDSWVGTFHVHIVERVAGTCTFTVQGRSRAVADGLAATPAFLPINVLPLNTNSVAAASYPTYAATAISDTGMFLIPATGMQVALLVDWTDGEWDVYVTRFDGAAA
jgi:hypothetical protein